MRLKRRIGSQQTNFEGKKTGLFKPEFIDRGVWLTTKCYLVQNEVEKNKYSCKGVSKKYNHLYFECYKGVLDVF